MPDREKVIKVLEGNYKSFVLRHNGELVTVTEILTLLKAQEAITGETSDGYHTFNELYHHRAVLFSVIVANYPDRAWKAKKHHDGTMYDGMFIVGIETPDGQATYHYDIDPYWDMFKCRVLDNAPEWDGHTPAQAIERIGRLAPMRVQEPRVMTLDELSVETNVYFESLVYDTICPALSAGSYDDGTVGLMTLEDELFYMDEADYGVQWRCWTSRPTDEQREATPWSSV